MTTADSSRSHQPVPPATHAGPAASASKPPAANPPAGRDARGQFAPGNPGGPGRAPKVQYIEREIIAIMASALTGETWLEIAEAVIQKAKEGNMTAVQWLSRTFLTGRLNEAAAADEVRLPPHIEMYELGRKQHWEWRNYMDEKRAEAEEEAKQVGRAARPVYAVTSAQPSTDDARPAVTLPAPAPRTVPQTVAPADRVTGFRVTKGAPATNGQNRTNTEKNAPPAGPCTAS